MKLTEEMIDRAELFSYGREPGGKKPKHSGSCRDVRVFRDYVVKTDWSSNTYCWAEWEIYTAVCDEIRKLLARPLYLSANRKAIIMERLTPLGEEGSSSDKDYDDADDIRKQITGIMGKEAAKFLLMDDCFFNFGRRKNGEVVYMDYAGILGSYQLGRFSYYYPLPIALRGLLGTVDIPIPA